MQNKHVSHLLKTCLGTAVCMGVMALTPMASAAELADSQIRAVSGVNKVNQEVSYSVTFDPETALDDGNMVSVTFPAEFDVSSAAIVSATNAGAQLTSATLSVVGNTLNATLDASGAFSDVTTITFSGIETPSVAGLYPVEIETPADSGEAIVNVSIDATVTATPANVSTSSVPTPADYSFTLSGLPALSSDAVIYLIFPDGSNPADSNFDISSMVNPVVTGYVGAGVNINVDSALANRISIAFDPGTTLPAGGSLTVELENVINPFGAGVHGIGIDVYEGGAFAAQGIANAAIGNAVQITAIVAEALLLTLDSSTVALSVDPAEQKNPLWEAGQDLSQHTLLNVRSNSPTGYTLRARMDDGTGQARLVDGNGNAIDSDSKLSADNGKNYFGYYAVNNSVPVIAAAANAFTNVDQLIYEGTTTDALGANTVADHEISGGGGQHAVNYDLNVSFLTPAGMYTSTIFYTVVASF